MKSLKRSTSNLAGRLSGERSRLLAAGVLAIGLATSVTLFAASPEQEDHLNVQIFNNGVNLTKDFSFTTEYKPKKGRIGYNVRVSIDGRRVDSRVITGETPPNGKTTYQYKFKYGPSAGAESSDWFSHNLLQPGKHILKAVVCQNESPQAKCNRVKRVEKEFTIADNDALVNFQEGAATITNLSEESPVKSRGDSRVQRRQGPRISSGWPVGTGSQKSGLFDIAHAQENSKKGDLKNPVTTPSQGLAFNLSNAWEQFFIVEPKDGLQELDGEDEQPENPVGSGVDIEDGPLDADDAVSQEELKPGFESEDAQSQSADENVVEPALTAAEQAAPGEAAPADTADGQKAFLKTLAEIAGFIPNPALAHTSNPHGRIHVQTSLPDITVQQSGICHGRWDGHLYDWFSGGQGNLETDDGGNAYFQGCPPGGWVVVALVNSADWADGANTPYDQCQPSYTVHGANAGSVHWGGDGYVPFYFTCWNDPEPTDGDAILQVLTTQEIGGKQVRINGARLKLSLPCERDAKTTSGSSIARFGTATFHCSPVNRTVTAIPPQGYKLADGESATKTAEMVDDKLRRVSFKFKREGAPPASAPAAINDRPPMLAVTGLTCTSATVEGFGIRAGTEKNIGYVRSFRAEVDGRQSQTVVPEDKSADFPTPRGVEVGLGDLCDGKAHAVRVVATSGSGLDQPVTLNVSSTAKSGGTDPKSAGLETETTDRIDDSAQAETEESGTAEEESGEEVTDESATDEPDVDSDEGRTSVGKDNLVAVRDDSPRDDAVTAGESRTAEAKKVRGWEWILVGLLFLILIGAFVYQYRHRRQED